jgi:HEPN domain-containing protein
MREEIANWYRQAGRDLISASNSLNSGDFYLSVFMSQQAVEKGLKAIVLTKFRNKFIPEHSLIKLGKKVNIPKRYHVALKKLSPQYFLARYPDASEDVPFELYDKEVALEFLNMAKEVFAWINKQLE